MTRVTPLLRIAIFPFRVAGFTIAAMVFGILQGVEEAHRTFPVGKTRQP